MKDEKGNVVVKLIIGKNSLEDHHLYLGVVNPSITKVTNYLGKKTYSSKQSIFGWYLIDDNLHVEETVNFINRLIGHIKG